MDVQQVQDDLNFVRGAVVKREQTGQGPAGVLWIWAIYVLVGYALIDLRPAWAAIFFVVAGVIGGLLSGMISRRYGRQLGEHDPVAGRRIGLHFGLGVVLAIATALAVGMVFKNVTGQQVGQLVVVMIGLVYFLAGVHIQRYFMALGPVLIIGGLLVGFVPHYGWTLLGATIAAGLILPTLLHHPPGKTIGEAD